jgi:hypothetical protein
MSDKEQEATPVVEKSVPRIIKTAGKEFDISTPEGIQQLESWGNEVSTVVGRQGNELGALRHFKEMRTPTEDEQALIAKVASLREDGDHRKADELLFSYAKQTEISARRALEAERANERTWKTYFKSRPELLEIFDEETVRDISEAKLDIYKTDDPYKVLDSYWLSKVQKPKEKSREEKAPATLSGSQPRSVATEVRKEEPKALSFLDILDTHSVYSGRRS